MINREDIRCWATRKTYDRGRQLCRDRKVLEIEVYRSREYDDIEAEVQGSGRNIYHTSLMINRDKNRLEDYFCECPAHEAYLSICKHNVATLLEYLEGEKIGLWKEENLPDEPDFMGGEPSVTTPGLLEILNKRAEQRALPVTQDRYHGKVHLQPMLTIISDHAYLDFKIGSERMYILKNVLGFAEAMTAQKYREYGKQLAFVHVPETFDAESRGLTNFIVEYAKEFREEHMKTYYSGRYYDGPSSLRKIELNKKQLEDFLLLMEERTIEAEVWDEPSRQWFVTPEELEWNIQISEQEWGIELSVESREFFTGNRYLFFFQEGTIYRMPIEKIAPVMDFLSCVEEMPSRKVIIDKKDAPAFCRDLLPQLEEIFCCEKIDFSPERYGMEEAKFEIYLDAPSPDFITIRTEVLYGEKRMSIYEESDPVSRDVVREAIVKHLVADYGNAFDKEHACMVAGQDEDLIYDLLTEGIAAFQKVGDVFVSDSVKRINVRKTPQVSLGISLAGDMLEMTIESEQLTKDELVEILSRYSKKKKYYRLRSGEFIRMDEGGLAVLKELQEDLMISPEDLKKDTLQLPKYRALYLDARSRESDGFSIVKDRGYRTLVRHMKTAAENDFEVPAGLQPVLREYQREGFFWLKTLCQNGFGGILADDMGLGKTLQVLCFLLSEFQDAPETENRRTLVVTPASLVYNWENEIRSFAPELSTRLIVGNVRDREEKIQNSGERDVLLTSYDLLRRDVGVYRDISFFCQVIDEAQFIKNQNTKGARAVKSIQARFRIALTGTPMENRLSELWSIFDYLMPGFLYNYKHFREELEVPIVINREEKILSRLQKMIGPFVLRRLKGDVLKDLPDKLEENVVAPLEEEQRELYQAHVQRMKLMLDEKTEEEFNTSKIQILSELTRLRQMCCHPALIYEDYRGNSAKTDLCLELVENAIGAGHKILLFSQFTSMLQILQEGMQERGISFYTLTGSTGKEKRARMVEEFNRDDTPVFCISLKAGGTGLNLTAADVVIHYDPWWNVAVQNQATDRAHRIGQKNVVTVYRLVMKDSIEENIVRLQEKKKELAEQVLSGEQVGSASFSREDIMEILGGIN